MSVISLPYLSLALALVDRAGFYRKLHAQGQVFVVNEPRLWLVAGYAEVSALLRSPLLLSSRAQAAKLLYEYAEESLVQNFYHHWLMYMDGGAHASWRVHFLRAFPRHHSTASYSWCSQFSEVVSEYRRSGIAIDFTELCIRPFVVRSLANLAGISWQTLETGWRLLVPILRLLHGRGSQSSLDCSQMAYSFRQWPLYLATVREEAAASGHGFIKEMLRQDNSIDASGVAVLPLIDVLDALVSLCGSIAIDVVQNYRNNGVASRRRKILETVRLFSPFQVCNRIAGSPFNSFLGIDCQEGERFCLLVGAANRDPRVFGEPDLPKLNRERTPLSFGLGLHSCPGRQWSLAVLEDFFDLMQAFCKGSSLITVGDVSYHNEFSFAGVSCITLRVD